jgi:ABC-2 type transport system ATP-binding protein
MTDPVVLLEAQGLSLQYGARHAVHDVNLQLRQGEVLGLLGPNGAGKSTTLKMLAGLLAPTTGSVMIKGIGLANAPTTAKRHLGYLPELPPIYPELTIVEYLQFCAQLHGIPGAARKRAIDDAMTACELHDCATRLIGNLSKGFQQRCGIAQAIIHRPAVVILDEPTVGLDPIQIMAIRKLIRSLASQHSVILSSHILPEIQAVCNRVVIMHRGRIVHSEHLDTASRPAFATLRVGFTGHAPPEKLAVIDGVTEVDVLDTHQFRLHIAAGQDPRPAVVHAAVLGGWGLIELHAELRTLEDTFVALTAGDSAALPTSAESTRH